jgi:hypothetical protein
MATITDFEAWLGGTPLEEQEDAEDLINSVQNVTTAGNFTTNKKKGRYFVAGSHPDILLLVNEGARTAFIAEVETIQRQLPDDLEAGFQRNMHNPKA